MIPVKPWMVAAFLLSITFLAYTPVIRTGGFIWDDDTHVTENELLRSAQGLRAIWTKPGPMQGGTCQYYPLTFSVFWAEYHLFKLQPLGYHLVNILLHAFNALLLWRILRRLRAPGALLAAAIFAVHPVFVESVAWVTELKNVLSGLFYLSSLLYYLRFLGFPDPEPPAAGQASSPDVAVQPAEPPDEGLRPHWPVYCLSILLFLCALASKTSTATLPAVILVILWWKNGRLSWEDLSRVSPMLILAGVAGLVTISVEKYQVGASGATWTLTPIEHCLLAGRILWFYAGKLIWPENLTFIYPRWEVNQAVRWWYLFPLATFTVVAALWFGRSKIGRGPMAATLVFIGSLAPVMGFLNIYFMQFSYVADHFQYLASMGLIALFAAAATQARLWLGLRGWGAGLAKSAIPLAAALLLTLGLLTWRQGDAYKSTDQMWMDTLKKNPSCWLAHNNFGVSLSRQGKVKEAIAHYRETLRLKPDHAEAYNNFGFSLVKQNKITEAVAHYREALRLKPDFPEAHNNLGSALAGQGKTEEAVEHYREALRLSPNFADAHNNWGLALTKQGDIREAAAHFQSALRLKPDYAEAHYNLGVALAGQGEAEEAITRYREALRLKPNLTEAHYSWGLALAGQGKMEEAVIHYQETLRLDPNYANAHNGLGIALATLRRRDEAIRHFREALRINPNFPEAQNNLKIILSSN